MSRSGARALERCSYGGGVPKRTTLLVEVRPVGPVTMAADPIPVLVVLRYQMGMGDVEDFPAVAVGWTAGEVLVRFGDRDVEVWLPAGDVRRV